jgi:hypothetical protein
MWLQKNFQGYFQLAIKEKINATKELIVDRGDRSDQIADEENHFDVFIAVDEIADYEIDTDIIVVVSPHSKTEEYEIYQIPPPNKVVCQLTPYKTPSYSELRRLVAGEIKKIPGYRLGKISKTAKNFFIKELEEESDKREERKKAKLALEKKSNYYNSEKVTSKADGMSEPLVIPLITQEELGRRVEIKVVGEPERMRRADVDRALGTNRKATVSDIFNGKKSISEKTFRKLEDTFNVDLQPELLLQTAINVGRPIEVNPATLEFQGTHI